MKKSQYSIKCSLPLNVGFHIEEEQITHVSIDIHDQKALTWELFSQEPSSQLIEQIGSWISSYVSGKQPSVSLPISLDGMTPYTRGVLRSLQKIPFGKTTNYKQLAGLAGNIDAARAVGNACGRNPILLVIPCHRVIASNGRLGGFSAGLDIKKLLLAHETGGLPPH